MVWKYHRCFLFDLMLYFLKVKCTLGNLFFLVPRYSFDTPRSVWHAKILRAHHPFWSHFFQAVAASEPEDGSKANRSFNGSFQWFPPTFWETDLGFLEELECLTKNKPSQFGQDVFHGTSCAEPPKLRLCYSVIVTEFHQSCPIFLWMF